MLAISGSLASVWACGGRTGVDVFDDFGSEGGGQDAALDSARDVVVGDASVCVLTP